jgi:hypothetical protein
MLLMQRRRGAVPAPDTVSDETTTLATGPGATGELVRQATSRQTERTARINRAGAPGYRATTRSQTGRVQSSGPRMFHMARGLLLQRRQWALFFAVRLGGLEDPAVHRP